jgi:hypothetical protein
VLSDFTPAIERISIDEAQARIKHLLDRGIKRVEVGVKNGGVGSHRQLPLTITYWPP